MRAQRIAGLTIASGLLLFAQDWTTATSLPHVDMTGLTPAQQTKVLKLLRANPCTCGCGMKMAECRMKDSSCSYSKGMAAAIVDAVRHGKSDTEALAAAAATRWGHGPASHSKPLEDPIAIATGNAPVRGPANARVTLVEFSDFQCPFCIAATPQIDELLKAYPSQVKLVFMQFPLDQHAQAGIAAMAALAAHKQGKFWEMHDALFAQRGHLSPRGILTLAAGIGLDMKRFQADVNSPDIQRAVNREMSTGENIGVDSTPTLFVDGQRFNGPLTLAALKPVVENELRHPAKAPVTTASR